MSATRSKPYFPEQRAPRGQPATVEDLEQIEELGDEAIISQQTAPHAPQPRTSVAEEPRSVVITEHPPEPAHLEPSRKSTTEATVVIRDRRALDEVRQKFLRQQREKQMQKRRALYLWGALGFAAFVLGGIVAFLATDTRDDAPVEAQPKR